MQPPEPQDDEASRYLLALGLDPPGYFADYRKLSVLGKGATSVVYRALRDGDSQEVALKIMSNADAATDLERRRFNAATAAAATLDHPNIVKVLDFGEHDGVPFVVMTLVEGEDLKNRLEQSRPLPEEAARWIHKIANAIQHAHTRGKLLHRDLKPANIVIDRGGEPHVTDFGIAKRLDQETGGSAGTNPGTLCYMAPEQILPGVGLLTPASDVWSLGVMFYELLTHNVPFWSESLVEMVEQIRSADPVPPRELNPTVSGSFENICLKCLERSPARRYVSAECLGEDLERALRGERTIARAPSLSVRTRRWIRRHPRIFTGIAVGLALAIAAAALMGIAWRAHLRGQARELDTNAFIASGQAGAVLFQLREYADRLERTSHDAVVARILSDGKTVEPAPRLKPFAEGFDGIFVLTTNGRILAQWPSPMPEVFIRTYDFRDYFRGGRRLAESGRRGVYLARAYRSESLGALEFAFAAPLNTTTGEWAGLVVATIHAKAGLGAVRMEEESADAERITTALLGPRDNDRPTAGAPSPPDFAFLVHPGLSVGEEVTLHEPMPTQLRKAFGPSAEAGEQFVSRYASVLKVHNFRNPIPSSDGESLAAFAPVGRTGFVVLVETRKTAFARWPRWLVRGAVLATGGALVLALGLVALGIAVVRRQRRGA